MFDSFPFHDLRAVTLIGNLAGGILILNCYDQEQASETLEIADYICSLFPELKSVRISVQGQFAYGFPVKLLPHPRNRNSDRN